MNYLVQPLAPGKLVNCSQDMYPSVLFGHCGGETIFQETSSHLFGYVREGKIELQRPDLPAMTVYAGMYFSSPGALRVSGAGHAVCIERKGFRGLFEIGGPIEAVGRLSYIDGCRATVLVSPPRKGDPCLNLLTFPVRTEQSAHTHPTLRMGIVASGRAFCLVRGEEKKIPLVANTIFYLAAGTEHCFHSEDELRIIAYHPDTDVGPCDESHPMLSRTFIAR